jgi:hypothetical protein
MELVYYDAANADICHRSFMMSAQTSSGVLVNACHVENEMGGAC